MSSRARWGWLLVLHVSLAFGASASERLARGASEAIERHFDELHTTGTLNLQGVPTLAGPLLRRARSR